jgi:hypothetical protein
LDESNGELRKTGDLDGKVKSEYKGISVSVADLERYREAKLMRAKYRHALSQVKKQIRFLEGVLRGKEEI